MVTRSEGTVGWDHGDGFSVSSVVTRAPNRTNGNWSKNRVTETGEDGARVVPEDEISAIVEIGWVVVDDD